MADVIHDPFRRQLVPQLMQVLETRKNALATGSAKIRGENETVGERYAEEVGYIKALTEVINLTEEIERTMLSDGTRPAQTQYE